VRIFKREPALWLNLFAAVVAALGAFVVHLTTDQESLLNAGAFAVVGVVVAASTHDGLSAAVLGLFKALVSLGVGFGLHVAPAQQLVLMTLVAAATSMFVRTQVGAPVPARR